MGLTNGEFRVLFVYSSSPQQEFYLKSFTVKNVKGNTIKSPYNR